MMADTLSFTSLTANHVSYPQLTATFFFIQCFQDIRYHALSNANFKMQTSLHVCCKVKRTYHCTISFTPTFHIFVFSIIWCKCNTQVNDKAQRHYSCGEGCCVCSRSNPVRSCRRKRSLYKTILSLIPISLLFKSSWIQSLRLHKE